MGTNGLRSFTGSPLVAVLGVAFATSPAAAGGGNGNGNGGGNGGNNGDATTIDELIMYGIDNDTDELVRYRFDTDEHMVMSAIVDEDGNVVDKCEALGNIPNGPNRGLYAVSNYDGDERSRLIKFNPFDDSVTVYPQDIGFGNIEGMVARQDPETGVWKLWAVQTGAIPEVGGNGGHWVTICHYPPGNATNAQTIVVGAPAVDHHVMHHGDHIVLPDQPCGGEPLTNKNLIEIDPETGLGDMLMPLGHKFEGLAKAADDMLYASKGHALWRIDLHHGDVTEIGAHEYDDVEALEYAFGDFGLAIDVPGVPPGWTNHGALLGFSEANSALVIFFPANGDATEHPSSLGAFDLEGIIFLTEWSDPMGGVVAGFD